MSTHSLVFDDALELCDDGGAISGEAFWFETLADGAAFGAPQPVEVAINSLLRDGAITETQGVGNREQSFLVKVKSTDSQGIAAGVAALHGATGKRTTLVWTPPDGYGPPTVFDVETSSLNEPSGFDDLALMRNEQVYQLRLVCLPYARSVDKIVDDAGTPPSTGGTVLLNCESTTGWATTSTTGTSGYVVDSVIYAEGAGSIRSRAQVVDFQTSTGYTTYRSRDKVSGLSLSTGTGGYLSFAIRFDLEGGEFGKSAALDEAWMTTTTDGRQSITSSLMAVRRDANGFVHYVWPVDAGLTVTAFEWWTSQGKFSSVGDPAYVRYDDIELLPAATTDHQIVKVHQVQGSARTTGSLHIAAATDVVALGQVLAITVPSDEIPAGFQPDGRRWITQGTTTADTTALGGSYLTPNTSSYDTSTGKPIFDVPVGMLTAGPYTIVGLVKAESSSLTFGVQAQLRVGSNNVGPTSAAQVSPTGLTTGWQFITVGTVYLPPLPMQSADASTKVRLLFKGAKMAEVYMIPAWQVAGRPVADFSIIDCGTATPSAGGSSSNLWVDSPSTDQPQGGWWRGPTSDRANAQSAWPDAKKPGIHLFRPGSLTHFLTSTNAAGPTSELEYYPAWLGSAAL